MKTIGLISISDNAETEKLASQDFQSLTQNFKKKGYSIREGSCLHKDIHESSPQERADQINHFFADPDIDIVWPIGGGAFANEILPWIDFDLIQKHPKLFMGYSDTTVVGNALYIASDLITYHGPTFGSLRKDWFGQEQMLEQTYKLLDGKLFEKSQPLWNLDRFVDYSEISESNPEGIVNDEGVVVLKEGQARGTILGGNLSTFNLLFGTPWSPDLSGCILFLEECGENSIGMIRRLLAHIRQQPSCKDLSGIVFGKVNQSCYREYEIDLRKTLLELFGDLDIPILVGAPFGHIYPFQIFPIDGICEMHTEKSEFSISKD